MNKLAKFLLLGIIALPLVGCGKNRNLYLKDFYSSNKSTRAEVHRGELKEDANNVQFEEGRAQITCEALVVNQERDSFVDIVVYFSWSKKYVVYNEGNGEYICSSTTEFNGSTWNTKITFTVNIYGEHDQNGYISVNDINFLHSGSKTTSAYLNDSKNLSVNYHEHRCHEKVAKDEYLFEERNHFHSSRYRYSCVCGYFNKNSFDYFETDEGPIEHTFDKEVVSWQYLASNATCTEPKKYYYSCECGEHGMETFNYGEPLGHDYEIIPNKDETMEKDGTNTFHCNRCGYEEIRNAQGSAIKNGSFNNFVIENNKIISYVKYYNDDRDNVLIIPTSITSIENSAFSGCSSLTSITIPDSVTSIGDSAFSGCSSLTSITIPDSVTSIGDSAFSGCSSLTSIIFPDSVTSIGMGALHRCSSLVSLRLPFVGKTRSPDFSLGNQLFGYIFAGESYENSIGVTQQYSFYDGNVPKTRTFVCYLPASLEEVKISYDIQIYSFYNCSSIKKIILECGVSAIGKQSFYNCTSLLSVTIPDTVTSIGSEAFSNCTSLSSIIIPKSVTSIGNKAFYLNASPFYIYCAAQSKPENWDSGWANPMVGEKVRAIWNHSDHFVVDGIKYSLKLDNTVTVVSLVDTLLTEVSIKSEIGGNPVVLIENYAFYGYSSLASITIPDIVTSIGDSAFSGCSSLTSITIPDSVTSIGKSAFSGCSSLTSISIPGSVTSIGYCAFSDCSGLISLAISDGVKTIGDFAFSGCSSLTSIVIPNSVTSLGGAILERCSNLTSISIPFIGESRSIPSGQKSCFGFLFGSSTYENSVKTEQYYYNTYRQLKSFTFYLPQSLEEVRIHEEYIYDYTFANCSNLKRIILGGDVKGISEHAFTGCSSLESISIPYGQSYISDGTFSSCSSLTSITIPDIVTSIGDSAFSGCSSLTSITIPDSVTSIGYYAFSDCSSLTSVSISKSVSLLRYRCFYNCNNLKDIYLDETYEERKLFNMMLSHTELPSDCTYHFNDGTYYCDGVFYE